MESFKANNGKKNFLAKTWRRCRSINKGLTKSKSWNGKETTKKKLMTPEGFFPVYVGGEKQRFAVKTKYVNHPLFTMLLEDAETEYGYKCDGPIWLPCDVDLFCNVLAEMEGEDGQVVGSWSFVYGSCSPFNPGRRLGISGVDQIGKGYGSYEALIHPV